MLAHHTWLKPAPRLACGVFDYDCTSDPPQFSWKQVGLGALGGGITGGLGQVSALNNASLGAFGGGFVRGAISSALTQGIGVATGMQESLSWTAIAASALSAGVAERVGEAIGGANWQNTQQGGDYFKTSLASNFAGSLTRGAVMAKGGRIEWGQVLADGFGQTIGNSLVQGHRVASQQAGKAAQVNQTQTQTPGSGLTWGGSGGFGLKPTQQQVGSFGLNADGGVGSPAELMGSTSYPQPGSADFMGPMPAGVAAAAIPGLPGSGPYANLNSDQARSYGFTMSDADEPSAWSSVDGRGVMRQVGSQYSSSGTKQAISDPSHLKQQAEALDRQANQLADAAKWARSQGMNDAAADYQKHAEKAFYEGRAASLEASNIIAAQQAKIPVTLYSPDYSKWSFGGANASGLAPGVYTDNRTQSEIDTSLGRTTGLLLTAPLWIAGAGLSYSSVGLGLGLRSLYSTIGWKGTAALGFGTGSLTDAGMQYIDTESWDKNGWRPGQTLFAGTVGAFTGPMGATSGLKTNILLGGLGAAANTQFQNYAYGDDKSYGLPMVAGAMFGAFGYRGGAATTRGLSYYQPERYFANLNPQVPALFQPIAVNKVPQFFGVTAGGVISGTSPVGENLYKEFFVPKPGKP